MTEQISGEITHRGAWLGPGIQEGDGDWIYHLSADSLADLDVALAHAQNAGMQIPFAKEDFPNWTISKAASAVCCRPRDRYLLASSSNPVRRRKWITG